MPQVLFKREVFEIGKECPSHEFVWIESIFVRGEMFSMSIFCIHIKMRCMLLCGVTQHQDGTSLLHHKQH